MMRQIKTVLCAFIPLAIAALFVSTAQADDVDHEFGGSSNFVSVDDDGAHTTDWEIQFDDEDRIAASNFVIWDDTNGDFYEGGFGDDFAGTGSGIVLFDPASGLGDVDEATASSTAPLLPVTYSGGDYDIEQFTFAEDSGKYIIIQLKITNNDTETRRTKLMFANDFDMDGPVRDRLGFEADLQMVFQQDVESPWATGGSALLLGSFEDYRLGDCCDMTNPVEGDLAEDFVTGSSGGDQVTVNDVEVALLADLGRLDPGESACTAWVYGQTLGDNAEDGLNNLRSEFESAVALYNSIPREVSCGTVGPRSISNGPQSIPVFSRFYLMVLILLSLGLAVLSIRRNAQIW